MVDSLRKSFLVAFRGGNDAVVLYEKGLCFVYVGSLRFGSGPMG